MNSFIFGVFALVLLHLFFSLLQAIHERHENALLKGEMEKLREENLAMREMMNKSSCPKCGYSANSTSISMDSIFTCSDQQLITKITRLEAEVIIYISLSLSLFFLLQVLEID